MQTQENNYEDNPYTHTDKLLLIQDTIISLTDGEEDKELQEYYDNIINYIDDCREYIQILEKKIRQNNNPNETTITVDNHTIELLNVIKKYNEDASYNKVILFLILQYGERLQEHHPEALELLNDEHDE